MDDNNYVLTKKMKIFAILSFALTFIFMIFFMVSVLVIQNEILIIIFSILFFLSVLFEAVVLFKIIGVWYKNYTKKYKGL